MSRFSTPSLSNILEEVDSLLAVPLGGYESDDEHVRHNETPVLEEDPADDFEPLIDLDDLRPSSTTTPSPCSGETTLDESGLSDNEALRKVFEVVSVESDVPSTPSTPAVKMYDNWEGAALYSMMLDSISVLRPSSSSLLEVVLKITQQDNSDMRAPSMDTRVLQGIAEVEGYLRTARNALTRGYTMTRLRGKGESARLIRDLRTKLATARADATDLRDSLDQRRTVGSEGSVDAAPPLPSNESLSGDQSACATKPSVTSLSVFTRPLAPTKPSATTKPLIPDKPLVPTKLPATARLPASPPTRPPAASPLTCPPAASPPTRPPAASPVVKKSLAPEEPLIFDSSSLGSILKGDRRKPTEVAQSLVDSDDLASHIRHLDLPARDRLRDLPSSTIQSPARRPPATAPNSMTDRIQNFRRRTAQCARSALLAGLAFLEVIGTTLRIRRILKPCKGQDDLYGKERVRDGYQSGNLGRLHDHEISPLSSTGSCRKCILQTYQDARGIEQPGFPQTSQKYKQHASADMLRRAAAEAQKRAAAEAEHVITLATLGAPDVPHKYLPERPGTRPSRSRNDHEDDNDDDIDYSPNGSKEAVGNVDNAHASGATPSSENEKRSRMIRERFSLVSFLQSQLDLNARKVPRDIALVFRPVSEYSEVPGELDPDGIPNATFTSHRTWVDTILLQNTGLDLTGDRDADMRYLVLLEAFKRERERLEDILARAWNKQMWMQFILSEDLPVHEPAIVAPSKLHAHQHSMPPFLLAALLMVAVLHTLSAVAFPAAQYILATLKVVVFGAFTMRNVASLGSSASGLTHEQQAALRSMPLDLRTVLERLELIPDIVAYACCPKCFAIYLPDPSNPDDPLPRKCTRIKIGGSSQCRKRLVSSVDVKAKKKGDPVRTVTKPNRTYVFRLCRSWLAEFLGRPGIESAVLGAWQRQLDPSVLSDIMESPLVRDFVGPDGTTPFSVQANGAVHLVFSLFVDWFNPYGNKKAGKSHSIGAIYLACLNLPPELRYRPENIYLAGIIPGPNEPNVEQLNSLLKPLIDEFLELWDPGIYLMKTALRPAGRLVRAAIIPLVCDLPALRKTAGFGSYSSKNFCSFCPLTDDEKNNVERSTWPSPRSWQQHLDIARQWRDATTQAERKEIFNEHGIRWSELLRLPYWDPTRYAVLDIMHNLFLGEIMHHCRKVWAVDVAEDKQPATVKAQTHTPAEQQSHLDRIGKAVCEGAEKRLSQFRRDYLSAVARFNNIVGETSLTLTRLELATAIVTWAKQNGPTSLRLPPVLDEPAARFRLPCDERPIERSRYDIFTSDVLKKVRDDIASTVLPSWMEKAPANFGSPSHGKLKADQWRTVGTVNLIITLVRLWGSSEATAEERDVLNNFVHLICAVDQASRRSMTPARAASYDSHMLEYLRGLRKIYGHPLVPNHHLSLHLYPLLIGFGPVHGWWAFPFERYNGILQRLNTNSRPADLPATFMRAWYTGANLRWLMRTTDWPESVEYNDMPRIYETAFSDRVRGTRITDMLGVSQPGSQVAASYDRTRETRLSRHIYSELLRAINVGAKVAFQSADAITNSSQPRLPPVGQFAASVEHEGIRYASDSRDSYITFRSHTGTIVAGQITQIFHHQRAEGDNIIVEPFLVVNAYKTLTPEDAIHDPYRRFPDLNTWLVYQDCDDDPLVVKLQDVVSHFAKFTYKPVGLDRKCIVVRSLDRS